MENLENCFESSVSFTKRPLFQLSKKILARYLQCMDSNMVLNMSANRHSGTVAELRHAPGNSLPEVHCVAHPSDFRAIERYSQNIEVLYIGHAEFCCGNKLSIEIMRALTNLKVLKFCCSNNNSKAFSADRLYSLLTACPKDLAVHCDMMFRHTDSALNYFRAIGNRLRVLSLEVNQVGIFPTDVLNSFVNLEQLSLSHLSNRRDTNEDVWIPLFVSNTLMLNLRKLRIQHLHAPTMVPALRRSLTLLQEFECTLRPILVDNRHIAPFNAGEIVNFVKSSEHLRRIRISCIYFDYSIDRMNGEERQVTMNEVVNVLYSLKSSTVIEEVLLNFECILFPGEIREIRNACVALRLKQVNIVVNGTRVSPRYSPKFGVADEWMWHQIF